MIWQCLGIVFAYNTIAINNQMNRCGIKMLVLLPWILLLHNIHTYVHNIIIQLWFTYQTHLHSPQAVHTIKSMCIFQANHSCPYYMLHNTSVHLYNTMSFNIVFSNQIQTPWMSYNYHLSTRNILAWGHYRYCLFPESQCMCMGALYVCTCVCMCVWWKVYN